MSFYASSLAFALRSEEAASVSDAGTLQSVWSSGMPFVHAMSRNGVMLDTLRAIHAHCVPGSEFYLTRKLACLQGTTLVRALGQLDALIDRIDRDPGTVVEATKIPHTPHMYLHSKEFAPIPAEFVYPADAVIRDGYVYEFTEAQVRQMLADATASENPVPDGDDEGESLQLVFNLLKSHRRLLASAVDANLAVVSGEF